MNKKTWRIGGVADCDDCAWHYESYKNAQAVGANHAKHHDHMVRVETTLVSLYNYPEGYFDQTSEVKQT